VRANAWKTLLLLQGFSKQNFSYLQPAVANSNRRARVQKLEEYSKAILIFLAAPFLDLYSKFSANVPQNVLAENFKDHSLQGVKIGFSPPDNVEHR